MMLDSLKQRRGNEIREQEEKIRSKVSPKNQEQKRQRRKEEATKRRRKQKNQYIQQRKNGEEGKP